MVPFGHLNSIVLRHLKSFCAFYCPPARFIFLCFSAAWLPLTSAGTGIHVHCSEIQMMRSEAVYFPPEGTHGWSHSMTNTDLYWSQCRQGSLMWSYREEGFVFVCRHEEEKKIQCLLQWNSLKDISAVWIPCWQLLTGRGPFLFASLTRIQVEQRQTEQQEEWICIECTFICAHLLPH